jgi:hypothetical protein
LHQVAKNRLVKQPMKVRRQLQSEFEEFLRELLQMRLSPTSNSKTLR